MYGESWYGIAMTGVPVSNNAASPVVKRPLLSELEWGRASPVCWEGRFWCLEWKGERVLGRDAVRNAKRASTASQAKHIKKCGGIVKEISIFFLPDVV